MRVAGDRWPKSRADRDNGRVALNIVKCGSGARNIPGEDYVATMLRIHLFGPPRLLLDATPLPISGRPKVLPLLAFLVLHAGSPLSRETVARALWPDDDDPAARANLRRHLHYLRTLLPAAQPGVPWITTGAATLVWNARSAAWCDVIEFERCARSPETLAEAVRLYAGDFLLGCDEQWAEVARESYRIAYLDALERLINERLGRRDYGPAEGHALLLLRHDPWRENAVRALMRIRFEAGDRAGALAAYERFASRLREELGTPPMLETQAAYRALREDKAPPGVVGARATGGAEQLVSSARTIDLPFVGRDRELQTLREWGLTAAGGQGRTVTLAGEAGSGKSRLVREAAIRFEAAGGSIFSGSTASPERAPYQAVVEALAGAAPLAPHLGIAEVWLRALAPLAPGLVRRSGTFEPPQMDPARERTRLFEACAVFFAALAARRPLMLVFEDLHWAGAATLGLLAYLGRRLRSERVLVVVTHREEDVERTHPLRALRREREREGLGGHVALGGLSQSDVAAMLRRLDAATEENAVGAQLHSMSDGNPFFLGELVRDALETGDLAVVAGVWRWRAAADRAKLPKEVRVWMQDRLARLDDGARTLASVAAVVGSTVDTELLCETTGWSEANLLAALDQLIDRRLMLERSVGNRLEYAFAHQLVADAIYGSLGTTTLRYQHRRVAAVLEQLALSGRETAASEVALHWDRAGDFERASDAYVRAARAAFSVAAYEEGERFATRALELSAVTGMRFDALLLSESAASVCGNRALQAVRLEELLRVAETLDADAQLEVCSRRIALANLQNDRETETRLIAELESAAETSGSTRWKAAALEAAARMYRTIGDYARARSAFERLVSIAERSTDRHSYVAAYIARADTDIFQGRFDDARTSLRALRELVAGTQDRSALVRTLMTFARAALARQDYDEMTVHANEAHRISCEIGDREGEALALHTIANGLVYPFRVSEARATYRRAADIYAAIGHKVGQASLAVDEGLFNTEIGLLHVALAQYERAEAIATAIAFPWVRCVVRIDKAYALRLSGENESSATAAREALRFASELGSTQLEAAALGTLGAAESELGELDGALEHLRHSVELRRPLGATPRLGDNLCALAQALLRANEGAAALKISDELLALHEAHPRLAPQPTEWLVVAAAVARANGRSERASRLVRAGEAAFRDRVSRIDDDATRSAFAALPFNRAVVGASSVR